MSRMKNVRRDPVEIITTNVEALPVVRAWRALAPEPDGHGANLPARVELLRRRPKSVVYRLPGVGNGATDVIAKHCVRDNAMAERDVYLVLQALPVSHPEYYGYLDGDEDGFGWLFLGDAGSESFAPDDPAQQALATRWLATLHTSSAGLAAASWLPERGPAHYWEHLQAGRAAIQRFPEEFTIPEAEREILSDMLSWLERIESHWVHVEAICQRMPRALVHADFATRNVRLRAGPAGNVELLVFDWEMAGWGPPAVDLGEADLDLYHSLVQRTWPLLERAQLQTMAAVGRLLRGGIAAVHWDAQKIHGKWPDHTLDDMLTFRRRIITVLQELGWSTGTPRMFPGAPRS